MPYPAHAWRGDAFRTLPLLFPPFPYTQTQVSERSPRSEPNDAVLQCVTKKGAEGFLAQIAPGIRGLAVPKLN